MVILLGVDVLRARIARAGARAMPMLSAALYAEAKEVMRESKQLVPVDTGVLKASGFVTPPSIVGNGVWVSMIYGNAAQAYAVIQHENLWFHHDVGQALYLSTPFWNHLDTLPLRLASKMGTMFL